MKNINEKYAELIHNDPNWAEFKTTTLGNLTKEQFEKIEADYATLTQETQVEQSAQTETEEDKTGTEDVRTDAQQLHVGNDGQILEGDGAGSTQTVEGDAMAKSIEADNGPAPTAEVGESNEIIPAETISGLDGESNKGLGQAF